MLSAKGLGCGLLLVTAILGGLTAYVYRFAAFCPWSNSDSMVRMALIADPQMEGDAKLHREPRKGRWDLWFNDHYLRHVVKSLYTETHPTHIAVMGDIFSNQYISDEEFKLRLERFQWATGQAKTPSRFLPSHFPLVNLSGNHDIGYGKDITEAMLHRWQSSFGQVNHEFWLCAAQQRPTHRVVVLNTQNLDPSRNQDLRNASWTFLQQQVATQWHTQFAQPLLLLMHIPLYKPHGLCVDGPEINWNHRQEVIDQTMLSPWVSKYILYCLRPTLILTGHDHEGCKLTHHIQALKTFNTKPIKNTTLHAWCHAPWDTLEQELATIDSLITYTSASHESLPRPLKTSSVKQLQTSRQWLLPELTLRSVMGDYGGYSSLLEISTTAPNNNTDPFVYYYQECSLGHHIFIRMLLLLDLALICFYGLLALSLVAFPLTLTKLTRTQPTDDKKRY
ncbi:hypothetical protein H4R35_005515 [Dimargaris xerosporica]|nr:hypothetical protein H4R35_005515 [Dimargaris xerosporica]